MYNTNGRYLRNVFWFWLAEPKEPADLSICKLLVEVRHAEARDKSAGNAPEPDFLQRVEVRLAKFVLEEVVAVDLKVRHEQER